MRYALCALAEKGETMEKGSFIGFRKVFSLFTVHASLITVFIALCAMPFVAFAADKLVVKDSGGTNTVFKVTDTGRIGLSTDIAPSVALHAKGPNAATSQSIMQLDAVNANGGGGYIAYHTNNGALPNSGDRLGYMLFGSLSGTSARNGGGLVARAESAWTASSIPTYFAIETAPSGSTTRSERLRITSSGNVVVNGLSGSYVNGSAYVCVNNSGQLYTSESGCP
jgi:hypothetical protein